MQNIITLGIFLGVIGALRNLWPTLYIKATRTEKGISQAALAKLVGVSRNTISSIEKGQFNPA